MEHVLPSPRRSGTNAAMHRRLVLQDPVSRAAIWSRRLAWFGLTVLVIALALFRREPSIPGLAPIAGAYAIVAVALALALIAFIRIWQAGHRGVGMASGAFLLCLAMLAPAAYAAFRYATLPPGGDVSTDIEDPPSFSRSTAALKARAGHVPPDMPADQRKLQRRAYPKAVSIVLEVPAEAGFAAAQRAATALRWQVVEAIRPGGRTGAGRIEAIATNRLTGLVADITIRIRPRADGSRIDIRSASRLGLHDLGENARRIAAFTEEVEVQMETR